MYEHNVINRIKLIKTRQAMYVERSTEIHFVYSLLQWKKLSVTYSGFVFVALGIQLTKIMRNIVVRILPTCSLFVHFVS